MPKIEEFDVVIKTITFDELKQLFGEGRKDVRIRISFPQEGGMERTFINPNLKLIVETWEPKAKKP